jgi:hypothetical protein
MLRLFDVVRQGLSSAGGVFSWFLSFCKIFKFLFVIFRSTLLPLPHYHDRIVSLKPMKGSLLSLRVQGYTMR